MYEEKFIAKYNMHPLKVVGSEGVFGLITLIIVQIIMYFMGDIGFQLGYNPDGRLEDPLGKNLLLLTFFKLERREVTQSKKETLIRQIFLLEKKDCF